MSSDSWNQPVSINEQGTRAVVETNWNAPSDLCQMIFEIQEGGDCLISTCMPGMKPIRLNKEQMAGLAYFFRLHTGG